MPSLQEGQEVTLGLMFSDLLQVKKGKKKSYPQAQGQSTIVTELVQQRMACAFTQNPELS